MDVPAIRAADAKLDKSANFRVLWLNSLHSHSHSLHRTSAISEAHKLTSECCRSTRAAILLNYILSFYSYSNNGTRFEET